MQESILLFFQRIATPLTDVLAEGITMIGESYVFIVVITYFYWLVSRKRGFQLGAAFVVSYVANNLLKVAFRAPRPFESISGLEGKRVHTATGYSFPSGHTQGVAVFFTSLALIIRKTWVCILCFLLILLVAVSRVYLGVHWPVDVIASLFLGGGIAWGMTHLIDRCFEDKKRLYRYLIGFLVILGAMVVVMGLLEAFQWQGSLKIRDLFKSSGLAMGMILGFLCQERWAPYRASEGTGVQKIIRYLVGLIITVGLYGGLKILFPEMLFFDTLRYGLIGLWIAFLWPWIGTRFGLFTNESGCSSIIPE